MNKTKKPTSLRAIIRGIIAEELAKDDADDLNSIEVGDVVDVHVDEVGILPVRVIELIDDVTAVASGVDPRSPNEFIGPGFLGEIDPESGESGRLVFSLKQVLPGSKAKGYFPKLGSQNAAGAFDDFDDYGRPANNPFRKAASRFATKAISPAGHGPADDEFDDMDESDKVDGFVANTDADPHKADHADPTGRNWDNGLDEATMANSYIGEEIAEKVDEVFERYLRKYFAQEHMQPKTLQNARPKLEEEIHKIIDKLTG